MDYEIQQTDIFRKWRTKIKDRQASMAITKRLARAEIGHFGDSEPIGNGVSEMRIFVGKGYRIYYTIRGNKIILLLNGGIKSNKKQQQEDIALAKNILKQIDEEGE